MDYVNLGTIDIEAKKISASTDTELKKRTNKLLGPRLKKKRKDSLSKRKKTYKIAVFPLIIGLFLFGIYSFLPQIKDLWSSIMQGPAMVMSFLKNDPASLKQYDGVTNVLLVGIDKRSTIPYTYEGYNGEEEKNGFLADTIIVASYSHERKTLSMLSLPRDLWVEIPAFNNLYSQYTKINAAYSIGDMYGYEGGGLALTEAVVSKILGIPIHYRARVDFESFVQGIDLLGGIDVEVENTFDDWRYPREGYENAPMEERFLHLHFDVGWQHMDGETALRYARSRQGTNGEGSDFARAKRQQKVIIATRDKAVNMGFLESLPKIIELIDTFGRSLETNIEPEEMLLFYKLGKDFDLANAKTYVLDNGDEEGSLLYNPPLEQFGGGWVLLPVGDTWDEVQSFTHKIFYEEQLLEEEPSDNSIDTDLDQRVE